MDLVIFTLDGDKAEIHGARAYSLKPGWLTVFFDEGEDRVCDCRPTDNIDVVEVKD